MMDTVRLAELWIAGHITNKEFLYLCGAIRARKEAELIMERVDNINGEKE